MSERMDGDGRMDARIRRELDVDEWMTAEFVR